MQHFQRFLGALHLQRHHTAKLLKLDNFNVCKHDEGKTTGAARKDCGTSFWFKVYWWFRFNFSRFGADAVD